VFATGEPFAVVVYFQSLLRYGQTATNQMYTMVNSIAYGI